jgi:hypothetical protein
LFGKYSGADHRIVVWSTQLVVHVIPQPNPPPVLGTSSNEQRVFVQPPPYTFPADDGPPMNPNHPRLVTGTLRI